MLATWFLGVVVWCASCSLCVVGCGLLMLFVGDVVCGLLFAMRCLLVVGVIR